MRSRRGLLGKNDDNSCHLLSPLVNNFSERTEGEVLLALTLPVDSLLLERELVGSLLDEALLTWTPKKMGFLRNLICTCLKAKQKTLDGILKSGRISWAGRSQ